jgi:Tyrosine phosphatase family
VLVRRMSLASKFGSASISQRAADRSGANVDSASPSGASASSRALRRLLFGAIGVLLLGGIAVGLWFGLLRDKFVPKRFGTVVAGKVYRSGQISRRLIGGVIDRYHIGTIIDLSGLDVSDRDQQAEVAIAASKGVEHCCFPLRGNGEGRIERYADAVALLVRSERKGVPVLVHCSAGAQRTGACVAFYRLLVRGEPAESVYAELPRYGWDPKTDQILIDYANSNMRTLAELLVARHVIERVPDKLPQLHP